MTSATRPKPERRASQVTLDEIELARYKLAEAALIFDGIEDGEDEDWRQAFELLRVAARALGNVNVLDHFGIG